MAKPREHKSFEKTNKLMVREWDESFYSLIKATFNKVQSEFLEHSIFMKWVAVRVLMPLAVFYALAGLLFFKVYLVGSLFLGSLFFIYSNFLPDLDALMRPPKGGKCPSDWHERCALLLFAPVLVSYAVSGSAKPIYSGKEKEFHSIKALATYVIFLFILGIIFWRTSIQHTILPVFGGLGYITHLVVDRFGGEEIIRHRIRR